MDTTIVNCNRRVKLIQNIWKMTVQKIWKDNYGYPQ